MSTQDTQEAIKEAKRAYYREWRKKNKDKVQAYNKRFFERLAEKKENKEK